MKQLILSSKKLQGSLTLVYENGVLKSFTNAFKKPLNDVQEEEIKRVLRFDFSKVDVSDFVAIGLDLVPSDMPNGGHRVALFCQAYKQKYGNYYLVSGKEGAMLKKLSLKTDVDFEKLVNQYLECSEWWAQPKSISGMVSRINELRQWISSVESGSAASKWHFPDGYSKTREQECKTNEEIQAYWRHLRDLGYKKMRVGIIETWKRITSNQENI